MNKYDELYNFRMATIDDVDAIMKFIHDEWGENHILAHDKELFLWQYGRTEYGDSKNINVVLMLDRKNNNIVGIIGFIAYSNNKDTLEISPAITKVRSINMLPMSGVELIKRQKAIVGEKAQFASGANPKTIEPLLQKIFKHEVGIMQQFYMLNPKVAYKIANIKKKVYLPYKHTSSVLREISDFGKIKDFIVSVNGMPFMSFKSPEFISKRYFRHPRYKYRTWYSKNNCVLFGREICAFGNKILRIVDYRGKVNFIAELGTALHKLMDEENYEYIDFMLWPVSEELMSQAGFQLLEIDGENIVPNYFEPYVQENIRNHAHRTNDVIIFKADGDQDRPNR